jgi:hypothetical protein
MSSPELSDRTESTLMSLRGAIAVFKIRNERWPRTLTELAEARLIDRVPTDSWGRAFLWLRPIQDRGQGCLLSTGPDGEPGTGDDVGEGCDRAVLNQHLLVQAGLTHAPRFDAYGNRIQLLRSGTLAWSFGPDGKPDTSDDQMARIGGK